MRGIYWHRCDVGLSAVVSLRSGGKRWQILNIEHRLRYFVIVLTAVSILWCLGLAIYRRFFHPLRNIPGPFLATITGWYEFYQDVILDGQFAHEYKQLHEKYGPVVRVCPNRVHIDDPQYYREYAMKMKPIELVYVEKGDSYKKDPSFYKAGGGIEQSIIMLLDPQAHRQRKEMIRSMFSPRFMEEIAPDVEGVIGRALSQAKLSHTLGGPLDIQRVYQAITVDTIMGILFGTSLNLVDVALEPKKPQFLKSMDMFADNFLLTKHLPILSAIAVRLPFWLADKLVPGYARFRVQCRDWIDAIDARNKKGVYVTELGRPTIFDLLLNPNLEKGHKPLNKEILVDEAFALCFAGTDTTSYGLSLATFYLLKNPDKLRALRQELETLQTNPAGLFEYRDVLKLPYLTAVVKEALRCSTPVAGITPRIVPHEGAHVGGYFLPKGTIVSQTLHTVHHNETVWPEADKFIPERWLNGDPKELDKFFVTFGKGPRSCLGSNITYLEMYLTIANFFNQLDMTLYHTNEIRWRDSAAARICEHVKVTVDNVREPHK
ncbi:cytochrome P450 [Xylariaceae sp. FL0662B]|nr:cytochrome P450 [Xylariaceae sp. FL0662B]